MTNYIQLQCVIVRYKHTMYSYRQTTCSIAAAVDKHKFIVIVVQMINYMQLQCVIGRDNYTQYVANNLYFSVAVCVRGFNYVHFW